jgi:hypothetical protein
MLRQLRRLSTRGSSDTFLFADHQEGSQTSQYKRVYPIPEIERKPV